MEKRDRSEPERIEGEKLHLKDPGISEVGVVDLKDLQSNHQLQKGEGSVHIKTSESTDGLETQKKGQHEKEQSPPQDILKQYTRKKIDANVSSYTECVELKEDEEPKQLSDTNKKKVEDEANIESTEELETQKVMQQVKESHSPQDVPAQYSEENSVKNESVHQESKEFKDDEKSEQIADVNIVQRQKDESSLVTARVSNQTNQQDDTTSEECDVFEDENPDFDGNTKVQQTTVIPENIAHVLERESIQITEQQHNDAFHQKYKKSLKMQLVSKLGTNLVVKLKDEALKDDMFVSIKDPAQISKQDTNYVAQQDCDRIGENSLPFQEVASGSQTLNNSLMYLHLQERLSSPELEESHNEPLQTEPNLKEEVNLPLFRRPYHYRLQIPLDPWLPPVPEEEDYPRRSLKTSTENLFDAFAQRFEEAVNPRILTQRLEMLQYAESTRERHISQEMVATCEEIRRRCVKFVWSLVLGGILVVALYFLVDFLGKKYDSGISKSTQTLSDFRPNLNIPRINLEPDRLVANLDLNVTTKVATSNDIFTTAADLNDNIFTDMDNNDSNLVADLNYNVSTLKDGVDNNITFLVVGVYDDSTFLEANSDDVTSLAIGLGDGVTSLTDGLDDGATSLADGLDVGVTSLVDGLDDNGISLAVNFDNVTSLVAGLDNSTSSLAADFNVNISNSKAVLNSEVIPALHDLKVNVSTPDMFLNGNMINLITKFDVNLIN